MTEYEQPTYFISSLFLYESNISEVSEASDSVDSHWETLDEAREGVPEVVEESSRV